MPLNYSRFDAIELSDDSDIEEHPNVDKKSFIRMKQRHIHEQRDERKHKIAYIQAQIACNQVILPRIEAIYAQLSSPDIASPQAYFNSQVEQLEKNPSKDCPPGNDPSKIEHTYDGMILDLFRQVTTSAKEKVGANASLTPADKEEKLGKELVEGIHFHVVKLKETIENDKKTLDMELKEQKKYITSEDLHDGFSSKYVPPKAAPPPVPASKPKKKTAVTEYEVLNPQASTSNATPSVAPTAEEEEEGLPELTPALEGFSRIPIGAYEESFQYIQAHRDVVVEGATDALLVAAFTSEGKGKHRYAKQCVHQSLLLQYGEKLGRDGIGVFFKKMISGDKRAVKVFVDDFESTYKHLKERVRITKEEEAETAGKEQIQLVATSPGQNISFNVPDGPPPENLVLEGPGTEDLDVEEVRKALEMRWAVFDGFPKDLKEALKEGSLDKVNKVLGDMTVEDAEIVVQNLDMAGILSFSESGIRDETGKGKASDVD